MRRKIQRAINWKLVVVLAGVVGLLLQAPAWAVPFTSHFNVQDCTWSNRGAQNALFSLRPGFQLVLEGEDEGEEVRAEITVLRETQRITFRADNGAMVSVRARVLEEREFEDGELAEVSRNFVARCRETNDIFYFGEDVDDYEDGEIVGHDGAWRAGVDDAVPGILMPGRILLGAKYFTEIAPGVAEDQSRIVGDQRRVTVPAGTFDDCVAIIDTDALDPESENIKFYCPGLGLVIDDELELVESGIVTGAP